MISALAGYKPLALPLATGVVVGIDDLHCRLDSLGAGVTKEDVIQTVGRQLGNSTSELESQRLGELKGWHIRRLLHLLVNRLSDLRPTMARGTAEKRRGAIKNSLVRIVVHVTAFTFHDDSRIRLEIPI